MTHPNGKKWILLGLTLLMQGFVAGFVFYSFTFFIVPWKEAFSVQQSMLMLGMTGFAIANGLFTPFGGMIIDRFQAKYLCLIGTLAFAGGLLLISWSTTVIMVVLVFTLAMPIAMTFAGGLISQTLVARAFDEKRGFALGICAIGSSIGGFLLPPLVTNLIPVIGWRMVLQLIAALSIVLLFPMMLWVFAGEKRAIGVTPTRKETAPAHRPLDIRLLLNPDVLCLTVMFFVPGSIFVAVLHNLGAFAKELLLSPQSAGTIVATTAAVMVVAKIGMGGLADRIKPAYLYALLILICILGIVSTALADSLPLLFFGVVLLGCTSGAVIPVISVMTAARFGPARFGTVLGVIFAVASLVGLLPLLISYIRESSGNYRIAFFALLPLFVPAIYCFARFHNFLKRHGTPVNNQ